MFRFFKKRGSAQQPKPGVKVSAVLTTNSTQSDARKKLKQAAALKKEKRYAEACQVLKKAYKSSGSKELMIEDRLRLPMYLQLDGQADEGWGILNELNVQYTDVHSQAKIAKQMRVFLQKEKNYKQALVFAAWTICKEVEMDRANIQGSYELADTLSSQAAEYAFLRQGRKEKVYGKTPKGNPITDSAYPMFCERIEASISCEGVSSRLLPMLKKLKKEDLADSIAKEVSAYLTKARRYDLRSLRDILNQSLNV